MPCIQNVMWHLHVHTGEMGGPLVSLQEELVSLPKELVSLPEYSTQLNSKMFICNMQEHTYNHIGSLKPMSGLFDSTYRKHITSK